MITRKLNFKGKCVLLNGTECILWNMVMHNYSGNRKKWRELSAKHNDSVGGKKPTGMSTERRLDRGNSRDQFGIDVHCWTAIASYTAKHLISLALQWLAHWQASVHFVLKPIWNGIVLWMAPLDSFQCASLPEMREALTSSVVVFRLSSLQIQKSAGRAAADRLWQGILWSLVKNLPEELKAVSSFAAFILIASSAYILLLPNGAAQASLYLICFYNF